MKYGLEDLVRSTGRELKEKFKGRKMYNISEEQQDGLRSLVSRRKEEGLLYFETDKSGKMSVDTVQNFSEKMSQHLECGVEVDSSFVVSTEKELNARAVSWGRILGVGAEWGHEDRVKQSFISTSSYPPPIYGLKRSQGSTGGR